MIEFASKIPDQPTATRNFEPLKAGTVVPLRLSLCPSDYCVDENEPYITETKSGLRRLHTTLEITDGQDKGLRFFEDFVLPAQLQRQDLQMTEGQQKSCAIGARVLNGILIAARGGDPEKSAKIEQVESFRDLDGLTFWGQLSVREWNGKLRQGLRCAVSNMSDAVNQAKSYSMTATSFSNRNNSWQAQQQSWQAQQQSWKAALDANVANVNKTSVSSEKDDELPF